MKKIIKKFALFALFSTLILASCKKETPEPEKKQYTITYFADLPPVGQFKVITYSVKGYAYTDTIYSDQFSITFNMESGDILSLNADCNITTPNETVHVAIKVDGATTSYQTINGTGQQTAYCYYKLP